MNLLQKDLFILLLLLFIIVFHILAMANFWYWTISWLDIPMHFLGGFWIAVLFFWLLKNRFNQKCAAILEKNFLILLILSLGFVSLAGILWEFYEFSYDRYISQNPLLLVQENTIDTITDLLMDLIGGFTAVLFYSITRKSRV